VSRAALLLALALLAAPGALPAQVMGGSDLSITTDHVWRGLTRARAGAVQPALFVGHKGPAFVFSAGAWGSLEPWEPGVGEPTDAGFDADALAEVDYWAQVDWRTRKLATIDLTLGWTRYTFHGDPAAGGRGSEWDTDEIFASAKLSDLSPLWTLVGLPDRLPLAVELSGAGDLGPVGGVYGELALEADLPVNPLGEPFGAILLRNTLGLSFDQRDGPAGQPGFYDGNGPTHYDLSLATVLGFPLGAGRLTVHPAGHLQVGFDPATRRRSASGDSQVFVWGELTVSVLLPMARRP
jgi:hypothetical protein